MALARELSRAKVLDQGDLGSSASLGMEALWVTLGPVIFPQPNLPDRVFLGTK